VLVEVEVDVVVDWIVAVDVLVLVDVLVDVVVASVAVVDELVLVEVDVLVLVDVLVDVVVASVVVVDELVLVEVEVDVVVDWIVAVDELVLVDVLVDVVVASVVVVDELVLVEVDVLVDVVVASVVVVDELVLVEVDVLVVVGGAAMVSVPATGTIVIVTGPLCASMLDGVNVNTPLALAVNAPTLISTISPAPFPMTTFPVPVSKAIRTVPLEQSIGCSSGAALTRVWQPPIVPHAEQSPATVHEVPPLEQSDVQAFAVEVTTVMPFGLTSAAQNVGLKSTLKASVVRSGPV